MDIEPGSPLYLEAAVFRDKLVANNGDQVTINKLNDLLSLPFLHGGQQEKIRRILWRG